jgi:PAS domain S-box-containing protein
VLQSFMTTQPDRQLTEREHLFAAAAQSSDDAIITMTLDGTITNWNAGAEQLFGYSAREAIGAGFSIIVPDDRREEMSGEIGRIARGEQIRHHETVRVAKDGRRIDVSLSISPIRSPLGALIGASKIARDITEKKNAEQALLESEQIARAIIDTALDAFVQIDESGHVIGWNSQAEAMFGWPQVDAIGRSLGELIVPKRHRALLKEGLERFLRSGERVIPGRPIEIEAVRRDGNEIKVEMKVTALRLRSGWVFNAFVQDSPEKRALEEQLRASQKMEAIGQLTGGVAHDFNNILTVITGTIETLAEGVAGDPKLADAAKLIGEATARGAETTQRLLAFARKQPLHPYKTDVNALIVDAAKLLRQTLGEQIEIESILEDNLPPVLVDPSLLSTSLLNMALNARDAMPFGGKLMLETGNVYLDEDYARANREVRPGLYVMVAISDTGTGIPTTIRDRVFEPFFTTKGIGKGTGLGLSMVYGFIKQSGGHIKIYSEEGQGTTIKIYLPHARDTDEALEVTPAAPIEGGRETILIVEDDPLVRVFVMGQLESLGYTTLTARHAAEALSLIEQGVAFDLLFTDVILPGGINGRQLAEQVVQHRPSAKVLFTSGYTQNAIFHHGRLDPDIILLPKPYRKSDLARMVRLAISAPLTPALNRLLDGS